ncbi:MarR family winged helix-turn-helix transcriptional regulator [Microbacterium hydrothermale]|uniref:MarR family winged helix-turn-helix transcriptional regulator n=1 Tax=Microbacterium hydrothermale TaxID=857427 RepID=UPI00142DA854|nr:helix-turn-helix domain-containing protein [Microbacterium hydrothermale]
MSREHEVSSPLMEALTHYSREREAAAAKARKQLGVNELDAKALAFVGANPGMRPSELAATLGVTSAGITTMVERLVRRGILRRELDASDRRVNHIHLAIDLENEPWSQLAAFDDACRRIIGSLDPQIEADLADFLSKTTMAATERVARVDALVDETSAAA